MRLSQSSVVTRTSADRRARSGRAFTRRPGMRNSTWGGLGSAQGGVAAPRSDAAGATVGALPAAVDNWPISSSDVGTPSRNCLSKDSSPLRSKTTNSQLACVYISVKTVAKPKKTDALSVLSPEQHTMRMAQSRRGCVYLPTAALIFTGLRLVRANKDAGHVAYGA